MAIVTLVVGTWILLSVPLALGFARLTNSAVRHRSPAASVLPARVPLTDSAQPMRVARHRLAR